MRLIREAYYEDPLYVPLVRRSFELWRTLEQSADTQLVTPSGCLLIGHPESRIVQGALRAASQHGIPHELLDSRLAMARFPAFVIDDGMVAVYEPGAALLNPELCVATQLELANRHGAHLRYHEPVDGFDVVEDAVQLRTEQGRYAVRQLVVCAGAWMPDLLQDLRLPLTIEREVQHWFEPSEHAELCRPGTMPVAMCERADGRTFYTTPDTGHGVKIGWHHSGCLTTTGDVDRVVSASESVQMREVLAGFAPIAAGKAHPAEVCLYTNTPDHHFIVSRHPRERSVLLVSACSGHGFKFAQVIGEIVADLVTSGQSAFDLGAFAGGRF